MGTVTTFAEVADRVFVARYPIFDVTVGLVVGSKAALVVDTRASTAQGAETRDDVARVAGRGAVRHVVNTHVHFDHTFGNAAFASAEISAHERVTLTLEEHAAEVKALAGDPDDPLLAGLDPRDVADLLATRVRLPDHSVRKSAVVDLGGRRVILRHTGLAHTDGDLAVHVPDCGVSFLGDLVEESGPPSLGLDCWPLDWPGTLARHAAQLGEDALVVPGHGALVDRAFVLRQQADLAAVATVIRERHATGMALRDAARTPDERLPFPLELLGAAFARGFAQLDRGQRSGGSSGGGVPSGQR